jgi:hypothetical protein
MRSFWTDPYLWIHLAGLAALPIFLELCFIGLAVGDPVLPVSLEVGLVAIAGIAPIIWMQWQKPFCIFSLLALAIKPDQMTVEQRKLLRWFKTPEVRILSTIASVLLVVVLWKLYRAAPIAADVVPFSSNWRIIGLLIAAIAFLASNLFLQVPVSVLRVLFISDAQFATTEPYPVEKIPKDFTLLGLRVRRILPPLQAETSTLAITRPSDTASTPSLSSPDSLSTDATAVSDPVSTDSLSPDAAELIDDRNAVTPSEEAIAPSDSENLSEIDPNEPNQPG